MPCRRSSRKPKRPLQKILSRWRPHPKPPTWSFKGSTTKVNMTTFPLWDLSCRRTFKATMPYVRLNLFNHALALFRTKFSCILAIRYPVFRWELCKGCVWESVKKTQDVCIQRSLATGSRDCLATSKSPKGHTCEACRELKSHDSWSTTGQNIQSGQAVSSQFKIATRSTSKTESPECPVWMKTDFSHSSHTPL